MKKRLLQVLSLSVIMALLNAPSLAPIEGQGEIIKTDVAAQTETTIYKRNDKLLINRKESRKIHNSIQFKSASLFKLIMADKKSRRERQELEKLTLSMESELKLIESIENKEEYFIAYKSIIAKYPQITQEYETIYNAFSEEELSLLFKVVQAEIGDYSFEQKCNVVSVIFNRMTHDRFPNTLTEILSYDQFESISNGMYEKVQIDKTTILACEYIYIFGVTNDCVFFDSNGVLSHYQRVFNDGAHNFYKIKGE